MLSLREIMDSTNNVVKPIINERLYELTRTVKIENFTVIYHARPADIDVLDSFYDEFERLGKNLWDFFDERLASLSLDSLLDDYVFKSHCLYFEYKDNNSELIGFQFGKYIIEPGLLVVFIEDLERYSGK